MSPEEALNAASEALEALAAYHRRRPNIADLEQVVNRLTDALVDCMGVVEEVIKREEQE